MKLPFKVTAGSPSDPAQVGDTNFLAHYTGANRSMAFDELLPGIGQAVERFVLQYIGPEIYEALCDYFDTPTSETDDKDTALRLLQNTVAYYTAYHVLPERNGFISSMGMVQNTPTGGSTPMPQWAYKELRWDLLQNADKFLDRLLAHLEKMVADGVTWFDTWKTSDTYKVTGSAYFRQNGDMERYLNTQGSRRAFLSLIKYFREIEEELIAPILCTDLSEELAEQLAANDLSTQNKALLPYIRKAVANLGLLAAIPHHRIVIDGDGFRVVSQTDQYDDRRNQTNSIHENAIVALSQEAERKGNKALADLQSFLKANETTYTLWADSPCNAKPRSRAHGLVVSPDYRGGVGLF